MSDRDKKPGLASSNSVNAEQLACFLERRLDKERADVAEELHDALGGLLVAAKMDLSYIEQGIGAERTDLRARIAQMRETLDTAIAAERGMAEQLRPGLLVHLGLFAALRWYLEDLRVRSGRACVLIAPEEEVTMPLGARVSLYWAVVDALSVGRGGTEVVAEVFPGGLRLIVACLQVDPEAPDVELRLMAVQHRVTALGGSFVLKTARDDSRTLIMTKALAGKPARGMSEVGADVREK